jgi:putative FmdB family regulatory protein
MPIYEFLCQDCNRVFNFLARGSLAARRQPNCPKCGGRRMNKLFSRFAMAARGAKPSGQTGSEASECGPGDDLSPDQEARMERAMMSLAQDMDSIDENNPRQMASVMRRLSNVMGEPIDDATDEMIRRLEAGEDPDKVDEKMADAFGDEGTEAGYGGGPSYDGGLYDL